VKFQLATLALLSLMPTVTFSATAGQPNGYFWRDKSAGAVYLKANEFNIREPIRFEVREVWRLDPKAGRWQQQRFAPPPPKTVLRGTRQVYGSASDATIALVADQIGLFWVKWVENQTHFEAFAYSGMLCQDVDLKPPPKGFVAVCVPHADRAEATYVPDPTIHCVGPMRNGQ
jgi:hypothetical protein